MGGSVVTEDSKADTDFGAVDGGDWNIGRRVDGNADRYFGNTLCEFWKGDFSLTDAEIEAIAAGWPPWALGHTLDIYLPMAESVATLRDLVGGNDATRASAPTTVEHTPVGWLTGASWLVEVAEAAAADAMPMAMDLYRRRRHVA